MTRHVSRGGKDVYLLFPFFSLTVPLAVHAVPRATTGAILIDRRMRGGHILFAAAR